MLSKPTGWPPQSFADWSANLDSRSPLSNLPIIHWLQKWNRSLCYRNIYLQSIEDDITRQIVQRPQQDGTGLSPTQRDLLNLFAMAFKESRRTPLIPAIYIDDQLDILLWGVDEWTLLMFVVKVDDHYHIRTPHDELREVVRRTGAAVEDLLTFIAVLVDSKQP